MGQPGNDPTVMNVAVDVQPDASGFNASLRRQIEPQAAALGRELGQRISAPIGREIAAAITEGVSAGGRDAAAQGRNDGARYGTLFAKEVKQRLAGISDVTIGVDTSTARRELDRLRGLIDAATRGKSVNIGLDDGAMLARLQELGAAADEATRDRTLNITVDASSRKLTALAKKIAEIDALSAKDITIKIDVQVAGATQELLAFRALLDATTRNREVKIKANASETAAAAAATEGLATSVAGATGNVSALVAVAPLIAAVIVPAAAVATGAVAALTLGIAAAGAGIAVLALGAIPMISALTAMSAAEKEHTKNVSHGADVIDRAGTAERNLARVRQQAAQQIEDAARSESRAQVQAAQEVADARKAVAAAAQDAARQLVSADKQVESEQGRLVEALAAHEKAQLAVNAARVQAKQDAEDLDSQVKNNAIAQRQAALDLAEAKIALDHANANPATTKDQLEQAQIVYDRQSQAIEDLKREGDRLAASKADSDKKGIENSDKVKAAKEAEAQAAKAVADQEKALADARTNRDQVAADGQQKIKDAEEKLARARVQAAQQVADAHRALVRAQQAGAQQIADATAAAATAQQGYTTAINGSSTAADDLRKKLSALSPEARSLVAYLFGLKDELGGLSKAAQGFAGPLEKGLRALLSPTNLKLITAFVSEVSTGLGEAFQVLLTDLASPFWGRFFGWLAGVTRTVLPLFAQGFVYIAHTVANLLQAFEPVSAQFGAGLLTLLAGIAKWSAGLSTNKDFQAFLGYIMTNAPLVIDLVFSIIRAVIAIAKAFAPIGAVVMPILTAIFNWVANLPTPVLTAFAVVLTAVGAVMLIVAAAAALVEAPILAIGIAVAAVIAWLVYLFNTNKTFHDNVVAAWTNIRTVIVDAWNNYIWPALVAFWGFVTNTLVPALVYLWQSVLVPAWNAISAAVVTAWNGFIYPTLSALWTFITTVLAPALVWLWQNIIAPAFAAIGLIIYNAWTLFIWPALQAMWAFINNIIIPLFMILWQNVIVPVWDAISTVISYAWNQIISPVLNAIWYFIKTFLMPIFNLFRTIAQTVWGAISVAIQIAWGIIKIIFAAIQIFIQGVLAPVFHWLYDNVISPVFTLIWTLIKAVWENNIKPVFQALGDFIKTYVAPVFTAGVDLITSAWNRLKDAAKGPVDFLVNTVINQGIVGGLSWLADKLHVDVKVPKVPWPPKGWATGGPVWGAGTATSDSILARLSNDEHVWTAAEVSAAGGHGKVMALRSAALSGDLAGTLPGFATGGAVNKPWWQSSLDFLGDKASGAIDAVKGFGANAAAVLSDPSKALHTLIDKLLGAMPNKDTPFGKIITGMPNQVLEYVKANLGLAQNAAQGGDGGGGTWNGAIADGAIGAMQRWALDQRGKRYLWASVGPDTYDCSGLVGNLWAIATNHDLYRRYFTTDNEDNPQFGFKDGAGAFTVYLGPGHTAANVGGMHVEAYHGNGTPLAIGHVGTRLSYYNKRMHLPGLAEGGAVTDQLIGGTHDRDKQMMSWLATGWPEPPAGVIPKMFDSGGWLTDTRSLPGQVMPVYHGQARPDAVLTHEQFSDMHALAQAGAGQQGRGAGGPLVQIGEYHERGADPHAVAKELDWIARGLG